MLRLGYDPLAYRFFCLQSHYRKSLEFSWEALDNAAGAYEKLVARIAALKDEGDTDEEAVRALRESFDKALGNDLNTAMGITALYDVLKAPISGRDKLALIGDFDRVLSLGLLAAAEKRSKLLSSVRLACVRHAASVRPEPGSNSQKMISHAPFREPETLRE